MLIFLSLLLSTIFIVLALIHLNWFFGGGFGFVESLPTKNNGERVLNPKKSDILFVALGLTIFSFFYLLKSGMIDLNLPNWIMLYSSWVIPALFLLRVIGDFKYVGLFKKIKKTKFARIDTKLFSPLCLGIAIIGVLIQIIL